ncbi:uracil-DNA glycosylase family protein [Helicobacter marmotae]|uniref:Uracil-DNA glycosylase-like domain-containing protein n=1 Tax=Helicobacter marmotae TaxID=152490 RepID=A0A3D8I3X6_9HELI|nr:uracil-DNA glycosylase family protein [Helicobacter marmotae]RDU59706.1 hypothetical protein CQA63_05485 [Helicobacter marmotae]
MKAQILKLLWLKQLYGKSACGECYTDSIQTASIKPPIDNNLERMIENCSLCNRIKHSPKPSIGILNTNAPLCFVSEVPLIDEKGQFVQNKSAIMLENIIKRVFNLSPSQVSILSLVKCGGSPAESSEILSCMDFCLLQLQKANPKVCILLGNRVCEHILGQHLEGGRILWHNNRKFLVTYSLNELVRNPSLKAQAHNHFLGAKGQL